MTLQWPWALLGLLALPLVLVAYRRLLRRQRDRRAGLAAQGLVVPRPAGRDRWRHLAPALLVAALAVMLLALSRPVAAVAEPRREGTVVLAFDVSTSMAAKDIQPTRLDAAKAAAKGFVDNQPATVKIAVSPSAATVSSCSSRRPTRTRCSPPWPGSSPRATRRSAAASSPP